MNPSLIAYRTAVPVSFQFAVSFGSTTSVREAAFREVSGLSSELNIESVTEGGENRFVHQLPNGLKQSRLVLKRGVAANGTALVDWCKRILEGGLATRIEPKLVQVFLLDAAGDPLRGWAFENAYPVKWSVDALDARKNEVALETIELVYAASHKMR